MASNNAQSLETLVPLTVIVGEEPLLAIEAQDKIRSIAAKAGYTERVSFAFDGNSDYTPLMESIGDMSLFGEMKIIEVRLMTGNPGLRSGPKALQMLADSVGDGLMGVVTIPGPLFEVKKKKWFEALVKNARLINAEPISRNALPSWIAQRAKRNGQELSAEAVEFIANSTEGNLLACSQEINKLALLCAQGKVELNDLVSAVSDVSRYNAQDLSDAILARDAAKAGKIIEGLQGENVPIPSFLWMINDDLRNLVAIQSGARPFIRGSDLKKQNMYRLAKTLNPKRLENALERLATVERLSKGVFIADRSQDPWQELKAVCVLLCR